VRFPEKKLCEEVLLEKLTARGWRFSPPELLRDDYREALLKPVLLEALRRINSDACSERDLSRAVSELELLGTGSEDGKRILHFYKHGVPMKLERSATLEQIRLFDFENPERNDFIVSRQVPHVGNANIQVDLLLYVNGVPLVNIECKNPADLATSWYDAYRQVKRYEKSVPELYKYVQIGVAAEAVVRYFPIVPWRDEVETYEWKEEGLDPLEAIATMLAPEHLLWILRHCLFIRTDRGETSKVIARYMQYRAARKIVERVQAFLQGKDERRHGLIWHWQGSGKTLTMIFAAHALYFLKELENPTIFFVVDRRELEEQMNGVLSSLDMVEVERIGSIRELQEVLSHDDYRGKRGLFLTLIHKFDPGEFENLRKEIQQVSKEKDTVSSRRNVVVFADEAHQSQYGLLAATMRDILREAFFFAFTGTPIAKRDRNTYARFSYPEKGEHYLDKYFVYESIEDGFTVPIVYQPRLQEIHLDEAKLRRFLEEEMGEIPEDKRPLVEEEIARKIGIQEFLENPKRIERIAQDIAQHFRENVAGRFKALVATVSRRACVLYKEALDRYLPSEYSEIVFSFSPGDTEGNDKVGEYWRKLLEKYPKKDPETINRETRDRFKEEECPKILIVTDMLLTGFDAPILQTLYLDKPLREHRLLQALARVNRPYRNLKEVGLVIDYLGILSEFERAFSAYSKEDVRGIVVDFAKLREQFEKLLGELLDLFAELSTELTHEALQKGLEIITQSDETEQQFVKKYQKLRRLFELLGPDSVKYERLGEYRFLSDLYAFYRKRTQGESGVEELAKQYFRKTVAILHESTEVEEFEEFPSIKIDTAHLQHLLRRLSEEGTIEDKATSIVFALRRFLLVEQRPSFVPLSLIERVKELLKKWQEREKDYEKLYYDGREIIEQLWTLKEEQRELSFSEVEYALLVTLRQHLDKQEGLVEKVRELWGNLEEHIFPGWVAQKTARQNVEREIRRFVRRIRGEGHRFIDIDALTRELFERVEAYGI